MSTWTIAGIAIGPNGPVNGATCYAWKAQRFSSPPAQNAASPTGTADAGPVTSGTTYGSPGAYNLACPTNEAYYVAVQYAGNTYWTYVNDLNFTDEIETTVASGSTGQQIGSLTSSELLVASTTGFNSSGRINVTTSGGQAILAYTSTTGGATPSFNGITIVSGTSTWTVTTGAAVTSAQQIATLNQVVDDGSGDETVAGNLTVTGNATVSSTSGGLTVLGDVRQPNNVAIITASSTFASTGQLSSGLSIPVQALGETHQIEAELDIAVASTSATAIGINVSLPTGATFYGSIFGATGSPTAMKQIYFTGTGVQTGFITSTGFTGPIWMHGLVVLGTATTNSTGNFSINVSAVGTASSIANTATIAPGGFLVATRVN